MFFLSVFWAFFHFSLSPSVAIDGVWPPRGLRLMCPVMLPLLNTILLVTSGCWLTYAHRQWVCNSRPRIFFYSVLFTIMLGLIFLSKQWDEYAHTSFDISDSVYGSIFFFSTGFHGFHVLIGVILLGYNLIRYGLGQLRVDQHVGFEFAAWYWHFVDAV
jgi:cytochrome c oxidase subunit 3